MTRRRLAAAIAALCAAFTDAHGYNTGNHERMSAEAANASVLGNPAFFRALGVGKEDRFVAKDRLRSAVEQVQLGSRLEDDEGFFPPSPLPNKTEYHYRKGNHFLDPANGGRGLTPCPPFRVQVLCEPAPVWALRGSFLQSYSLSDARERFVEALISPQREERERKYGLLFRTLGQVLHLIQDMAQPQHTRNDFHLEEPDNSYELDTKEAYAPGQEVYGPQYDIDIENQAGVLLEVETPWQLWERGGGGGLAQFANSNFVSFGTDFVGPWSVGTVEGQLFVTADTDPEYLSPSASPAELAAYTWEELDVEYPQPGGVYPLAAPPLDGRIYFVKTDVHDDISGEVRPNLTSTLSIYEHDFTLHELEPCSGSDVQGCRAAIFTQNYFNFRTAREFLLPRAISYSAALVNNFFRGVWREGHPVVKLEASDLGTPEGVVYVINDSDQPLVGGELVVAYDSAVTGMREELVRFAVTIPATQGVSVGTPTLWTTLLSDMEPGGQIAFVYTGEVGEDSEDPEDPEDPGPISVAGRVCDCGKVATAADGDPDAQCRPFCPCKYLAFDEGDPGIPGDGITVTPAAPLESCSLVLGPDYELIEVCGWQEQSLLLAEAVLRGDYPDGMTITYFAGDGRVDLGAASERTGVSTATCSSCQTPPGVGRGRNNDLFVGDAFIETQENGVAGVAVVYSSEYLASMVTGSCRCDALEPFVQHDSIFGVGFCYNRGPAGCTGNHCSCTASAVPIDAVRVCRGTP